MNMYPYGRTAAARRPGEDAGTAAQGLVSVRCRAADPAGSFHGGDLRPGHRIRLTPRERGHAEAGIPAAAPKAALPIEFRASAPEAASPDAGAASAQRSLLRLASRIGRMGAWVLELPSMKGAWSSELLAIYELEPHQQVTPQLLVSLVIGPQRDAVDRLMRACLEQGTPMDSEFLSLTGKGRLVWLRLTAEALRDDLGAIVRMQGVVQDISDRKHDTDRLQALDQRLLATFEDLPHPFVTVDRQLRFTYVNGEAERQSGLSRQAMLGRHMVELFPAFAESDFSREFERALALGTAGAVEAYSPALRRWLNIAVVPTEQGLALYVRDVTERTQLRREVVALNDELAEVRRRALELEQASGELKGFARSLAHDLRQPVVATRSFGFALETALARNEKEKASQYASRIGAATQWISDYIEALLSLTRISHTALSIEDVDLGELASSLLEELHDQDPKRNVLVDVQHGLHARGDPALLRLLLQNLLGNAWKFTSRNEVATVSFSAATSADGEVVYSVADNGAGFDMTHADNLFQTFHRLHPASEFPGTGIGLANARKIVERHGGRIWALSQPGKGATFHFTLGTAATVTSDPPAPLGQGATGGMAAPTAVLDD